MGNSVPLSFPETIVGRETDCHLALTDYHEVSRRHARFYWRGGTWCVEDLGSTNGTFVNNVRANPAFSLTDGVVVQMGDFHARFRIDAMSTQVTSSRATQLSPVPPIPYPSNYPLPVAPAPNGPYPLGYPIAPPKNSGLALILSFLFAGLGQLYNGETSKAIPMLIGHFFGALFTLFCFLGAPALLGLWIWSMVDAYQSAERINRESGWPRSY